MTSRGLSASVSALLILCLCLSGCTAPSTGPTVEEFTFLTEEYAPHNYHDGDRPAGIAIDLLNETLRQLGSRQTIDEVSFLPWDVAYNRTLTETNTILFSTSRVPSREKEFKWAGPIASERTVLFSLRSRNISIVSASDLALYRIGVVRNDAAVQKLRELGIVESQMRYAPFPENLTGWLDAGEVDLIADGELSGRRSASIGGKNPLRIEPSFTLTEYQTYFAFNRNTSDEVVARFQGALDRLSTTPDGGINSTRDRILGRYLPEVALARMTFLTEEFPPFNTAGNGTVEGIAVDLLKASGTLLNTSIRADRIRLGTWSDNYRTALGTDDTVIFSTARTPEREYLFQWAGPIGRLQYVVLAHRNRTAPGDLGDLRIATIRDDATVTHLVANGVPESAIHYETEPAALVAAVSSGVADAIAYPLVPARTLLARFGADPNEYEIVRVLADQDMYFAFNRNVSPVVVTAVNWTIQSLKTEKDARGVAPYERILYRHIGVECTASKANRSGAMAVVNLTAEHLAGDTIGTIAAINTGLPPFRDPADPEVYAFVYDTNLTMVAHAGNYRMVGENYRDKTDVAGKAFRNELLATALSMGSGWVDYIYVTISESRLAHKMTYCRIVRGSDGRDYVVCAGTFRDCIP
jgi:polar amino acid transport system substrate-binding protein